MKNDDGGEVKGVLVGMEGQGYSYYIFFMEIVFLVVSR
jgi:hypothetical protein